MSFGFEFELLIPAYSLTDGLAMPPDYMSIQKPRAATGQMTRSPKIGTGRAVTEPAQANTQPIDVSFTVSVEHQDRLNMHRSKSWPAKEHMTSLEIATEPMDEMVLTEQEVAEPVGAIAKWAADLYTAVKGGGAPAGDHLTAAVPWVNYLGPAPGRANDPVVSADAYVQETYGLRLDKVAQEFTRRANALPEKLRDTTEWYKPLLMSGSTIPAATTTAALKLFTLNSTQAAEELRGLLILIRYYTAMRVFNAQKSGLGKNTVGVFYYKTQLSTVCHDLGMKYPEIGAFLGVPANREAVCDALNVKGRLRDWGLNILAGVSDSFFLDTMNPYSEELFAHQLGPASNQSVGVVVENRDFRITYPVLGPYGVDTTLMYPPAQWSGIATRLFKWLRQTHGL